MQTARTTTNDTAERARKNALIEGRILSLLTSGVPMPEAFDAVLGAGRWEQFAGDLYDALRAKAGVA